MTAPKLPQKFRPPKMYVPSSFEETDLAALHDFIEQHSFGIVVSEVEQRPFATHLPLLLDRTAGSQGTLIGHVARANQQWKNFRDQTVLAIFSGPHAYISPTWYAAENLVPTWNYEAVHVYGSIKIIDDELSLLGVLRKLVSVYERSMPERWSFDPTSPQIKQMLAQIVGFQIEITKIEGKYKLNQNHPLERQKKVVAGLRTRTSENAQAIADAMEATISRQAKR